MLEHLGFEVMPLGGRVRLGQDSRAEMPPRTHLFLKICGDDCDWITDVGFGSYSLTTALRLVPDLIQHTPHGQRRFECVQGRWFHQAQVEDRWLDLYEFNPDLPMYESDQKVANWYTQTHADTHFTYRLSVAIAAAGKGRAALLNKRVRLVGQDRTQEFEIGSAAQLAELLYEVFGLCRQKDVKALWKKIK